MKKIGVLLSGCGVKDGSEIHEAVLTLLAIAQQGAEAVCLAPDAEQSAVIDHLSGLPMNEKRNMLVESARIARGKIRNVRDVRASELDAVILPGGYGAVLNLCSFGKDGPDCRVHPDVERLLQEMHRAGKPIGALCIAPALVARVFQGKGLVMTIGSDGETKAALETLGQKHRDCGVDELCTDEKTSVVSVPAYMLGTTIAEIWPGIERLVNKVIQLTGEKDAL